MQWLKSGDSNIYCKSPRISRIFFPKIQVQNQGCSLFMQTSVVGLLHMLCPDSSPHFKAWVLSTCAHCFNCLQISTLWSTSKW